jgi:cephalosporin-C deacetylase-like acetyl esterase
MKSLTRRNVLMSGSVLGRSAYSSGHLSAADKPVRMGVVGVGNRGSAHVRSLPDVPGVEIPAICDINEANLSRALSYLESAGRKKPGGYASGPEDFRRMVARADLDAVLTTTPWEWHTPVCGGDEGLGTSTMEDHKTCPTGLVSNRCGMPRPTYFKRRLSEFVACKLKVNGWDTYESSSVTDRMREFVRAAFTRSQRRPGWHGGSVSDNHRQGPMGGPGSAGGRPAHAGTGSGAAGFYSAEACRGGGWLSRKDSAERSHHRHSGARRVQSRKADLRKPATLLRDRECICTGQRPSALPSSPGRRRPQHRRQSGQGERLEYLDRATGKRKLGGNTGEHSMAGVQCLLTGTNIARYFIWDGMRALDYLLTRSDVDPKRIGVAGNSGGGTQSSYLAAFEPRLAAAAPSCYLTSWEKLWSGPGPQDAEQNFVNFLKDGLDFPDFLIAFAPKPIQMATATKDFFPIDGAKATFAEAHRIFEMLDAGPYMGFFEFDDTHGWSKPRREATYRWFARWLQGREDDGVESALKLDSPKDLQCTETGQVGTSFPDAETVRSLNVALAERLAARRNEQRRDIPELLRARLGVSSTRAAVHSNRRGDIERQNYKIEKIEILPEPGITVPTLAFVPSGIAGRKPAVLYVNPAGKAVDSGEGSAIETLVRRGNIVLAFDPRGWGESAPLAGPRSHTKSYQTAMRALLVGKSMVGMQTSDLLAAFDYVAARTDVDAGHISVVATGRGSVMALYGAVLEGRIEKVTCVGAPDSYMSFVRMEIHKDLTDIVLPGVLSDFDLPDIVKALGPRCIMR